MLGLISPLYKCGHIEVNMEQSVVQAHQPSAQHGLPRTQALLPGNMYL